DYIVLGVLATLVSIGTAGVPGTATVAAATVLAAAGLPLEFIAVTLPISIIADMARTLNNVTAAATSATIVARQTGLLNDKIFDGVEEYIEDLEPDAVAPELAEVTTASADAAEPATHEESATKAAKPVRTRA